MLSKVKYVDIGLAAQLVIEQAMDQKSAGVVAQADVKDFSQTTLVFGSSFLLPLSQEELLLEMSLRRTPLGRSRKTGLLFLFFCCFFVFLAVLATVR